jgi:cytochrome c oxidase cbb3-type subunit 1
MAMKPFYMIRVLGGVLYLTGALIMVYNFWKTIRGDVNKKEINMQVQGVSA